MEVSFLVFTAQSRLAYTDKAREAVGPLFLCLCRVKYFSTSVLWSGFFFSVLIDGTQANGTTTDRV